MRDRLSPEKSRYAWLAAFALAAILVALAVFVRGGDAPRHDDRYTLIAAALSRAAE